MDGKWIMVIIYIYQLYTLLLFPSAARMPSIFAMTSSIVGRLLAWLCQHLHMRERKKEM